MVQVAFFDNVTITKGMEKYQNYLNIKIIKGIMDSTNNLSSEFRYMKKSQQRVIPTENIKDNRDILINFFPQALKIPRITPSS